MTKCISYKKHVFVIIALNLSKVKRKSKLSGDRLVFTGEWIPSFVKTKEKIIGSPSSSVAKRVAPRSQVKAGKRRRGKRGKRK